MWILFKNLIRDIKKSKGQFLSILIIITLGVMFYVGINTVFKNLVISSESYYGEYRLADLWLDFYKVPLSVKDKLKEINNIKMITGRIVQDASINISGENATLRFITLPDIKEAIVNDITIASGRYFSESESNQCLLEEEFFKANNLKLGDYIYPVINGDKVKIKVIGTVKSPEFVYTLKDASELIPDNKKFGIIFIKHSFGEAIFGYKGYINSASIIINKDSDIKEIKADIKKKLESYGLQNIIDRDQQTSTMMLNEEIKKLQSMGGSFPVIFFIVAAVIIYIMMGRMVENQRIQIGVLKALGFSNIQVLTYYMCYSALIAVIGSILGSILGTYMGIGLTSLVNQYFHLPLQNMRIYYSLALPASLLTLFFCLIAGYNACKLVFKIMPSEAMRTKAPESGKPILIEKIRLLWNNIGHIWRIILRNLFRYKKRALLTSLGIIFSSAILLVALSMGDSIDFLVEQQYKNIQNYDIKINLSKIVSIGDLKEIKNISPHITSIEPIFQTGIELSNGWKSKNVGFTALIDEALMYRVQDKNNQIINVPEKGILISEKLADTLGLKQNEEATIKFFFPGKDKKEVTVKGIIVQYVGLSTYTSMENLNDLLGEGEIANSAVLKIDDSKYEEEIKSKLKDIKSVSSVESKADSKNSLVKNMEVSKSSINVLILLAAVLLIAVLYNIATINIFERQRELATLKVLGFKDSEIKKLIFNENYIITIFGIILGMPLGIWLGSYLMARSSTDSYSFPFIIETKTYIITIVLTLLFTFFTNLILVKKIKTIDMIEVLKNKE